jgi:hypothetical protein
MNTRRHERAAKPSAELRADRALGLEVVGLNGRPIGRLEEFRVERRGADWIVTEYEIGGAGLLERLGLGARLLFGRESGGYLARWDQLELNETGPIRLTCPIDELRRFGNDQKAK